MTGAIILAAGSSSRMGQSKQMLDIDGQPLLRKTVAEVLDAGIDRTVVVLGANEAQHVSLLDGLNVEIVYNASWVKGMGTSIRTGVEALTKYAAVSSILILVCDQPLLTSQIISNVVAKFNSSRKPIVASSYRGVPGVPVLFDRSYFERLKQLPDDQGAKKLILQNRDDIELVSFPGGEIDLDTMADYEAFLRAGNQ
jgi:molybdenum cofactor cytidylyltransferase